MIDDKFSPSLRLEEVKALAKEFGDSFYLLDGQRFSNNFNQLSSAFAQHYPAVSIAYSYKTNYTPRLCQVINALGGFAEVVSEMEYQLAKRIGVAGSRIIFNGPSKAEWAFFDVLLAGGTVNLDSARDVNLLCEAAEANPDRELAAAIRINFPIGTAISRFGLDASGPDLKEALDRINGYRNIRLKGLHCHYPNRDLESFRLRTQGMIDSIRRIFPDDPPETINLGGGMFGYLGNELRSRLHLSPPSFADYAEAICEPLREEFRGVSRPTLFLEPGTSLVANAQEFFTKIVSIKTVRGRQIATVAGSLIDIAPWSRSTDLPVALVGHRAFESESLFDVVGFTCVEADVLSYGLKSNLHEGDYLCFGNVGAYSTVFRPPFILPSSPIVFRELDGTLSTARRRQSNEDVFRDFVF